MCVKTSFKPRHRSKRLRLILKRPASALSRPNTQSGQAREELVKLVRRRIRHRPFEYDGESWAAGSQESWAGKIGVSVRTLRKITREPPFITARTHVKGRLCALLRIGTVQSSKATPKALQKELCSIWRSRRYWAKPGKAQRISPYHYGCLCGLVEAWGYDAPKIFSWTLDHWQDFILDVKAEWKEDDYKVRLEVPSLPIIRKFADIAREMYDNAA